MFAGLMAASLSRLGFDLRRVQPKQPDWPIPSAARVIKDRVLLLLTPPNSGSTAIADFLGQQSGAGRLYGNCEGQWLVKGLSDIDRWWPEKYVDYASVASVWAARIAEKKAERPLAFVVEKSPPNLVRYRDLLGILPNARVVVNNRDPYANVASQLKRYQATHYDGVRREEAIQHLARLWLFRSKLLRRAQEEDGFPVVTYETFCADPGAILDAFGLDRDAAADAGTAVRVKDYPAQGIHNMNARQIGQLAPEEVALISLELEPEADLVGFFGYALLAPGA